MIIFIFQLRCRKEIRTGRDKKKGKKEGGKNVRRKVGRDVARDISRVLKINVI